MEKGTYSDPKCYCCNREIEMKIKLKPIDSRFKRLIHDFGADWVAMGNPTPMSCFGGMLGITCIPATGVEKWSNFKLSDVEVSQ